MSGNKLDLSNYTENQPTPWTDEQYRGAFQSLVIEYNKIKAERDTLIDDIAVLKEKNEELKEEMKSLREESNITVFCALMEENSELKQKNEGLERENEKLHKLIEIRENALKGADRIIKSKEHENKALRLQADTYFDEWQNAMNRIEELEKGEDK